MGSDEFVGRILNHIDDTQELSEIPLKQRRPIPKTLTEYQEHAQNRNDAMVQAYASGGFSMKEIGKYFGLHYSRVSRIITMAKGKT
ncbi:hypothetical protein [Oceanicoccus sp. KOV_DT_Chl]|uniref:hypothetical protein n=1 Tax=Oceanicoccus sp. KOV_DT_Chl TaxID=1904639 RepID=UPI0011AF3A63|nr:hypothetical protein [Oceanicoccus sp. KOV_DT_Chl]